MKHRFLLRVFAGLVALLLGSVTLVGSVPLVGGDGKTSDPGQGIPAWRSISEYSCKPEAADSIRRIQRIEEDLNKRIQWLSRNRKLLEQNRFIPEHYFLVAAKAIEKAYKDHGAQNLSRGFNSEAFFEKMVLAADLGPKLSTNPGEWKTEEAAYHYLRRMTGIPGSFAFKDFFDHNLCGAARRHASRFFIAFEQKVIRPLEIEQAEIMEYLTSAGLCDLKKSEGPLAVEGECNQRLAKVKAQSDVIQREAESLLAKLTNPNGTAGASISKSLHLVYMKWETLSDREGKNCPAVKDYIEKASARFVAKFRAVFPNAFRQSR